MRTQRRCSCAAPAYAPTGTSGGKKGGSRSRDSVRIPAGGSAKDDWVPGSRFPANAGVSCSSEKCADSGQEDMNQIAEELLRKYLGLVHDMGCYTPSELSYRAAEALVGQRLEGRVVPQVIHYLPRRLSEGDLATGPGFG